MRRQFLQLLAAMICACVFSVEAAAQTSPFHVERQRINSQTDLLTVFAVGGGKEDLPLVSVLFETMGDDDPANDRPRYVWSLTYAAPDVAQRIAAAIPFFYRRTPSKSLSENGKAPPPIFDFKASRWRTVARALRQAAQFTVIDDQGFFFRAAPRSYNRNSDDHRRDHLHRALAVLFMLESGGGYESAISAAQLHELQARLAMSSGLFSGLVKREALDKVAQKHRSRWERTRARNWEFLRQRAEAEGLVFQPLAQRDGSVTHAMLWIAREELNFKPARKFDKRFLNIADPRADKRLRDWNGHVEVRWLNEDNRQVEPETAGARRVDLIPLAVYGLNHPRTPALLIDFRDPANPKVREVSRRLIDDLSRTVFRISPFRRFPLWAARKVFDFVTRRRGDDFNQASRLKSYAELDLLLMLDESLSAQLRSELIKRVRRATTNPMENSLRAETRLAYANYEALLANLRRKR